MSAPELPRVGLFACPRCQHPLFGEQSREHCPECGLADPTRVGAKARRLEALAAVLLASGVALQLGLGWVLGRSGAAWLNSDRPKDQQTWLLVAIASSVVMPCAIVVSIELERRRERLLGFAVATARSIALLIALATACAGVMNAGYVRSERWVPRWWEIWLQSWPGIATARWAALATLAIAAGLVWQISRPSERASTRWTARALALVGFVIVLAAVVETTVRALGAGGLGRTGTSMSAANAASWLRDQRPILSSLVALGAGVVATSRWHDGRKATPPDTS